MLFFIQYRDVVVGLEGDDVEERSQYFIGKEASHMSVL